MEFKNRPTFLGFLAWDAGNLPVTAWAKTLLAATTAAAARAVLGLGKAYSIASTDVTDFSTGTTETTVLSFTAPAGTWVTTADNGQTIWDVRGYTIINASGTATIRFKVGGQTIYTLTSTATIYFTASIDISPQLNMAYAHISILRSDGASFVGYTGIAADLSAATDFTVTAQGSTSGQGGGVVSASLAIR